MPTGESQFGSETREDEPRRVHLRPRPTRRFIGANVLPPDMPRYRDLHEPNGTRSSTIDTKPPSQSRQWQLEAIIKGQFDPLAMSRDIQEWRTLSTESSDDPDGGESMTVTETSRSDMPARHVRSSFAGAISEGVNRHIRKISEKITTSKVMTSEFKMQFEMAGTETHSLCARLMRVRGFTMFFVCLTFYALFVPDADMALGDEESRVVFSIISSVVMLCFMAEIVIQSFGRQAYFLRAHFWLDIVACVSLLPDTWLAQELLGSNAMAAGRASRISRMIRLATRTSRIGRIARLLRVVRVASLMPQLRELLDSPPTEHEVDKALSKKLKRIFMFLDEDKDGFIPKPTAEACCLKLKDHTGGSKKWSVGVKTWAASMVSNALKVKAEATANSDKDGIGGNSEGTSETYRVGGMEDEIQVLTGSMATLPPEDTGAQSEVASPLSHRDGYLNRRRKSDSAVSAPSSTFDMSASVNGSQPTQDENVPHDSQKKEVDFLKREASGSAEVLRRREGRKKTELSRQSTRKSNKSVDRGSTKYFDSLHEDTGLVRFEKFKEMVLEDDLTAARLRKTTSLTLREGNSIGNLTSRHSEVLAVKVALVVLMLLLTLSLIDQPEEDFSAWRGIYHIQQIADRHYPNTTVGDPVPGLVADQVALWMDGVAGETRNIVYLDVNRLVYCDDLTSPAWSCTRTVASSAYPLWESRSSVREVFKRVDDTSRHDFRVADLSALLIPDILDSDRTFAELDAETTSLAVVDNSDEVRQIAWTNIAITSSVVVIIVVSIGLLTKDLASLSSNLLKPLREVTDDMESIALFEMANSDVVEEEEEGEGEGEDRTANELRLIRSTFDNMKKAIKSWGKYVPWPVVQVMMRANDEACMDVKEVEVSILFSDIASFTTIVESIAPENSLLLLSRYFNDMSKIIDDYGGIVLEFIGDAILCIYGQPLPNPDHATFAVNSGLRMLAALRRLNEWARSRDLPEVKVRCGIHTGRVLVGNMGFKSRLKYGIVGEESNIPAVLEESNKTYGTSLLVSSSTLEKIEPGVFITRPIDYVQLRQPSATGEAGDGPKAVELIHQVIGEVDQKLAVAANTASNNGSTRGKTSSRWEKQQRQIDACTLHTEAMRAYIERDFARAESTFHTVSKIWKELTREEDKPSIILMKRCRSYLRTPPPPDWNGVWVDKSGAV